jgi:hypothetical protein
MTTDGPTHDMTGAELTPEEQAMYREASRISDIALEQCKGQSITLLQAVGFNVFEAYMQNCNVPENLRGVADVLRVMANDMDAKAAAH